MNRQSLGIIATAALAAIAFGAWGCSQKSAGPQTVKLTVSDRGFVPAEITVKKGAPVTLLVTRETDATCAKEIVIAWGGGPRGASAWPGGSDHVHAREEGGASLRVPDGHGIGLDPGAVRVSPSAIPRCPAQASS
jgi:hypothetical protein